MIKKAKALNFHNSLESLLQLFGPSLSSQLESAFSPPIQTLSGPLSGANRHGPETHASRTRTCRLHVPHHFRATGRIPDFPVWPQLMQNGCNCANSSFTKCKIPPSRDCFSYESPHIPILIRFFSPLPFFPFPFFLSLSSFPPSLLPGATPDLVSLSHPQIRRHILLR